LAGGGSKRRCEVTEAAAAMAGGGRRTHAQEEREAAFYSQARAEASLLHSEATDALRRGYGARRAGAVGGSTASR
jgi:hypothetical protein